MGRRCCFLRLMWIYRIQPEFTWAAALLPACCCDLYYNDQYQKRKKEGKKKKPKGTQSECVRSENVNAGQERFFSCWKCAVLALEQGAGSRAGAVFVLLSLPEWPFSACTL